MNDSIAALPLLFGLLLLFGVLIFVLEIRALSYAYRAIGISPRYVTSVLLLTLLGAFVNIPLAVMTTGGTRTIVAVNLGGALIPALVSLYLFGRSRRRAGMLVAVAVVAVMVNRLAVLVPGSGIAVPVLLPPLIATAIALILTFREAPAVAYVAGSVGTLVGADLWNVPRVHELGAPIVAIGGAGTFDGVFLTGIIAGVLAAWISPRSARPVVPVERSRVEDRAA